MRWARRIAGIALFVALLVAGWRFAAQNSATVSVDVLFGRFEEVTVWMALFAAFLAGAVLSGIVGMFQATRLGMETRRYRKVVRGLEAEVHQLRNLPLQDEEAEPLTSHEDVGALGRLERGT